MCNVRIFTCDDILVPRGRAPFGQHQESRPLAKSNTGSPRFTDFPSLCACSESSLTNLIGSGLNLLCLLSHSKTECRWTRPEVAILGADQKERGVWGREWCDDIIGLISSLSIWYLVQFGGTQGWRSGESACLPPMCPGFDSQTLRHMWVGFVVSSLLCSERFFPGNFSEHLQRLPKTTKEDPNMFRSYTNKFNCS